jgi:serine/threonine-protein kinase
MQRAVALKLVAPNLAADEDTASRFLREAKAMRTLKHEGIVTVYDAGSADGQVYMATQLIEGGDLRRFLATDTRAGSTSHALRILTRLASALDYAHSRGIVHRDIKPANILLDEEGAPVLADFGIAKALDNDLETIGSNYDRTPRYMAPEQARGEPVGHRADLYSFGCIAFEMLTGKDPFHAVDGTVELMWSHSFADIPKATDLQAGLPPAVDTVFARALAKNSTTRYPSAEAFLAALEAALTGAAPPPRRPRRRWRVTRRWTLAGIGAAALALITVLVMVTQQSPPVPSLPPAASGVPRGALLYQAKLDGSGAGFADLTSRDNDPTQEAVRFVPHKLELAVLAPGGNAGIDTTPDPPVTNYIGDLALSITPGSDVKFAWGLRWAVEGKLAYEMWVDTAAQYAQFRVWNGQNQLPISPRVDIPGLQTGRIVPITVVIHDTHLTLYIDGKQVSDINNSQVPPAQTKPGLDVYSTDHLGTIDIHTLSYYAIANG